MWPKSRKIEKLHLINKKGNNLFKKCEKLFLQSHLIETRIRLLYNPGLRNGFKKHLKVDHFTLVV